MMLQELRSVQDAPARVAPPAARSDTSAGKYSMSISKAKLAAVRAVLPSKPFTESDVWVLLHYGMARTTIRQALRVLEAKGEVVKATARRPQLYYAMKR